MAIGPITSRVRQNFVDGRLSTDLLPGVTVVTAPDFVAIPAVASPNYARLTLDPSEEFGEPEVVTITEHTLGSDTLTCARAAEGSVEREHPATTEWRLAMTQDDFQEIEQQVLDRLTLVQTDLAALNVEVDALTAAMTAGDTAMAADILAGQTALTSHAADWNAHTNSLQANPVWIQHASTHDAPPAGSTDTTMLSLTIPALPGWVTGRVLAWGFVDAQSETPFPGYLQTRVFIGANGSTLFGSSNEHPASFGISMPLRSHAGHGVINMAFPGTAASRLIKLTANRGSTNVIGTGPAFLGVMAVRQT